jgi:hypothetical protein
MLGVIMLNVVMLRVIVLNVVMLSGLAVSLFFSSLMIGQTKALTLVSDASFIWSLGRSLP